jgi:energy-coupling factor transporter ATP-binding protein EcfA2
VKITKIEVSDFRGFPGPAVYDFEFGNARNLFIYGENGSGKSSLFWAIREFFNRRRETKPFSEYKNNLDGALTSGHVTVHFDDGTTHSWKYGGDRQLKQPPASQTSLQVGCFDYRSLLETNFAQKGDRVNLFPIAVEYLVPHLEVPVDGRSQRIGELWQSVLRSNPEKKGHYKSYLEQCVRALKRFNTGFEPVIKPLIEKATELLSALPGPGLTLGASYQPVEYDAVERELKNTELILSVQRNGIQLLDHHNFLNEAKLSAIGLVIYLAGLLISVPAASTYPKLLVLDDVLVGLDMANRLPALKLLEKYFSDWQIILLTFDRAWYEIAKQQLGNPKWRYYELFAIQVGNHEQPLLLPDEDHLYRAMAFLDAGQVKAASVHVRTAFELLLKAACQHFRLPVKFHPDARKVPSSDLWAALQSATYDFVPARECSFDDKGKVHWRQPKNSRIPVVDPPLQKRIQHAVSWVLNPLSHSQSIDRYRAEIDDAIYAIDDLRIALERVKGRPSIRPTIRIEEIVSLLKAYIAKMERHAKMPPNTTAQSPIV